jgi:hypothetical protein
MDYLFLHLFMLVLKLSENCLRGWGEVGWGSSSDMVPVSFFKCPQSFFLSTSLLSRKTKHSRLILYLPCLSPAVRYFCKESGFPLKRMVFRNQALRSRYAHCFWDVTSSFTWQSKEVHTQTFMYNTYYFRNCESSLTP